MLFLIFSRILVQINAKEFLENSRETLGFSRTILLGNLARSREYKQYRKQKQRQQKGDEKRTRYEVTKIAPSPFSQERYPFWGRGTGVGLQKGGSGRIKPNFFIARGESPFQTRQTDYLSPIFTHSISRFIDTPRFHFDFC